MRKIFLVFAFAKLAVLHSQQYGVEWRQTLTKNSPLPATIVTAQVGSFLAPNTLLRFDLGVQSEPNAVYYPPFNKDDSETLTVPYLGAEVNQTMTTFLRWRTTLNVCGGLALFPSQIFTKFDVVRYRLFRSKVGLRVSLSTTYGPSLKNLDDYAPYVLRTYMGFGLFHQTRKKT